LQNLDVALIRQCVEDVVESMKKDLRSDVLNLHAELICQMDCQTTTVEQLLQRYAESQVELREELHLLRRENKELRELLGS